MRLVLAFFGLFLFAGCVETTPAATDDDRMAPGGERDVADAAVLVAEMKSDLGSWEFSACPSGEGPPLPRTERVPNGTHAFRIAVDAGATSGLRAGYTLDGSPTRWTEVVAAGESRTFEVPVAEEGWEWDRERWTFHYQPNAPDPATQPCYTGASAGGFRVAFEAVR